MSDTWSLPCVEDSNHPLYHSLDEKREFSCFDKMKTVVRISEEALEKLKEVAEKYGDEICERINCGYGAFVNHIINRIIENLDCNQVEEYYDECRVEQVSQESCNTFGKYCMLHRDNINRIKGERGKNFRKVKIDIYIERCKLELFKWCVDVWESRAGLKTQNKHEYEYKYSKPNVSRAVDIIIRFCPKIWES